MRQGYIFFKYIFFQESWGRFSRHNICVASQKEGEGKKKGKRGRKKGKRGRKIFFKVLGKVFNT